MQNKHEQFQLELNLDVPLPLAELIIITEADISYLTNSDAYTYQSETLEIVTTHNKEGLEKSTRIH